MLAISTLSTTSNYIRDTKKYLYQLRLMKLTTDNPYRRMYADAKRHYRGRVFLLVLLESKWRGDYFNMNDKIKY